MDQEFLQVLIVGLPNWVGFLLLVHIQNRFNTALLDIVNRLVERDNENEHAQNTIVRRTPKF